MIISTISDASAYEDDLLGAIRQHYLRRTTTTAAALPGVLNK